MTLDEIIEPTLSSATSKEPSLVSFTAVGSMDNVDQSNTAAGTAGADFGNGTITQVAVPFQAQKSNGT